MEREGLVATDSEVTDALGGAFVVLEKLILEGSEVQDIVCNDSDRPSFCAR
jgi:hypothetical protein